MAYRLSLDNNYLVITDDLDNVLYEAPKSRVTFSRRGGSGIRIFYDTHIASASWTVSGSEAEFVDVNGDAFSTGAVDWLQENTGFSTAAGGSAAPVAKTGSTIVFTENAEYNASSPLTSGNITIDNTGAVAGTYVIVYLNMTTEPTIVGDFEVIKSGTFKANTVNAYHFYWSGSGGYLLSIQTTALNFFEGDFTTVGLSESPTGTYTNNTGSNYTTAYGVTDSSFTGDFIFSCELDTSATGGSMIGISAMGTNRAYNNATPWKFTALVSNSTDGVFVYTDAVNETIDVSTIVSYASGNQLELRRVSDNVKLYYNDSEIHNFGTLSGAVYGHISTFSTKTIKDPTIQFI